MSIPPDKQGRDLPSQFVNTYAVLVGNVDVRLSFGDQPTADVDVGWRTHIVMSHTSLRQFIDLCEQQLARHEASTAVKQ